MTDAQVEARARRRTALVVAVYVAAAPLTVPWTAAAFVGWRLWTGWWPWEPAWSGRRYR
jgi:hypothetical protein